MNIERLQHAVFGRQKTLGRIYKTYGSSSLAEYAAGWKVVKQDSPERQAFFDILNKALERFYGGEVAREIAGDLAESPLISTIDHHGIFGHPFFLNSNLIFALHPSQKNLVCLPTAGVSLNNNTSWSGCLLLTGDDGVMRRVSFFPDRLKTRAVLTTPAFVRADAERVLARAARLDFLPAGKKQRLNGLIEKIFLSPAVLGLPNFSGQAAAVSRALWAEIFPQAPALVYAPLETTIGEFIADYLAARPEHPLYKLFFTADGWQSLEKYFQGSLGAFTGAHKGSFLFWGVNNKGRRVHLIRKNNHLADHEFTVPADAGTITGLLKSGRLYPTSLVCFLVLLSCGLTCLGGFNQVNWLTVIKRKFLELLREWGEQKLAAQIAGIPTDNFAEAALAFGVSGRDAIYKATALDLYLDGGKDFESYKRLAQKITLAQAIDAQLPEIYKVITAPEDRDMELQEITEKEIIGRNGLAQIILNR